MTINLNDQITFGIDVQTTRRGDTLIDPAWEAEYIRGARDATR